MSIFAKIFGGVASPVVNAVSGYFKRRQTLKGQKVELEHVIHLQKMKNVEAGRIAEVEWNKNSISKAGWRPGFLTIILSLPMILVFIPTFVPYIEEGFAVLDTTPFWYRSAIAVMISSAFGFKKYADWTMTKKFTTGD